MKIRGLTKVDGRIIFAETTVPAPKPTEYSRWISTGQFPNDIPSYSIQRFNYKPGERGRTFFVPCDPYYRVYHLGFSVHGKGDQYDFDNFEDACKCADRHNRKHPYG